MYIYIYHTSIYSINIYICIHKGVYVHPKTNMKPENHPFEKEKHLFGFLVSFREGNLSCHLRSLPCFWFMKTGSTSYLPKTFKTLQNHIPWFFILVWVENAQTSGHVTKLTYQISTRKIHPLLKVMMAWSFQKSRLSEPEKPRAKYITASPQKKSTLLRSIESWLVIRDPLLLVHFIAHFNWVVDSSPSTIKPYEIGINRDPLLLVYHCNPYLTW